MKKVLSILPVSIAGVLIVKGFNSGFRSNGCYVIEKDVRDLTVSDIENYRPDIIFGYDYSYLHNKEISGFILSNKDKYKLVHYFADEPDGQYAYTNHPEIYNEFKKTGAYSFVWDREYCSQLPDSRYLPLAVNAKAYKYTDFYGYKYGISFVGRPLTPKRQKILCRLVREFKNGLKIFSYEPHFVRSIEEIKDNGLLNEEELNIYRNSFCGYLRSEKELAYVYRHSRINLNITLQGSTSLNYRVFEVPASQAFLITDDVSDLGENFEIGKDLEVYKDEDELVDKIRFYLNYPGIAEKIAYNGYSTVIKRHSYTVRANNILQCIKK